MKTDPSHDPLMDEILGHASPEFRESMRAEASRLAGRRRRGRARRRVAIAASIPVAIAIAFLSYMRRPSSIAAPQAASFPTVHTKALASAFYTTTKSPVFTRVTSRTDGATIVETATAKPVFQNASDGELLALFPGRPIGLVSDGPGHARLVFLDEPSREQ